MKFPEKYRDLIEPETKAFLFLATVMPDGSPQVTPVWFDTDGELILVNTNEGRIKERNMRVRHQVALVIQDPTNPYRYLQIRGEVVNQTRESADEHIDLLSQRYTGQPWSYNPEQKRVIFKIKPRSFDEH